MTLIYEEEEDLERLRDLERALLSLTAHVLVLVTVIRSIVTFLTQVFYRKVRKMIM